MSRREVKPCGTAAAYQRHLRAGETPCKPCSDANLEKSRKAGKRYIERQRALRQSRDLQPVEVPLVVQGRGGLGPCAVAENGFIWDPQRDDESPSQARDRHRVAAAVCVTQCPVFGSCRPVAGAGGVVAGQLPRRLV